VRFRHLRLLRVASPVESRLLTYGAASAVVPRRHVGGFPIKLLQYMEASRAIVARAPLADTLAHGESGWLIERDDDARSLAAAIARMRDDRALADRLGEGARRALVKLHAWPALATDTLGLVRETLHRRR
jgi:glycosyltransferase involved in cell wall biosynthesis